MTEKISILKTIEDNNTYINNYKSDGGIIINPTLTKAYMVMAHENDIADNIEFGWMGEGASTKRTDGTYSYMKYFSKIYDFYLTNDGTQTTEASQPYVFGNIAYNEHEGMKNPNGGSRYITHPTISFASTDEWSVTTVLNWNGGNDYPRYFEGNDGTYAELRIAGSNYIFRLVVGTTTFALDNKPTLSLIGKNSIITITYNNGLVYLFINGTQVALESGTASSCNMQYLMGANGGIFSLDGILSAHIIRSQAITASQVAAEAALLQEIYPEIPSVEIGTQTWQTSNCDMVATPMGNVIANVTEAANVEKVTNGGFDTDTDWVKGTGWTISGGTANAVSASFFSIYQNDVCQLNKWYKITFTVSNYLDGSIAPYCGDTGSGMAVSANGTYTQFIKSTGGSGTYLYFSGVTNFTGSIDNVSVEEVGWAGSQDLYDGLITQGSSVYEASQAAAMWCYYNNDSQLGAIYGKLYNWFAVSLIQQDIDLYNAANPTATWGWHVPSSTEFTTLQTYLGGSTVAGGKMKVEGLDYWTTPNTGATNWSGFSSIGSGYRNGVSGVFSEINASSTCQSITESSSTSSYRAYNESSSSIFAIGAIVKKHGWSLRLIKD